MPRRKKKTIPSAPCTACSCLIVDLTSIGNFVRHSEGFNTVKRGVPVCKASGKRARGVVDPELVE
jgi:hypothetical protein